MDLRGQYGQRGYAMATLLVSLAVMSVLMSAALPAWRHQAKREKEAELVFRGEQYARAIRLWEMKMGPGSRPTNVDMLVQQRFLRKKYKDPMTEDGEFQLLFGGINPVAGRGAGARGGQPAPQPTSPTIGVQATGVGIVGVASKSTDASIRIYKGGTHYNEWRFVHAGMQTAPGAGFGAPVPGGRGRGAPGAPTIGPGRSSPFPGPSRGGGPLGPGGRGIGPGGRGRGQ